MKILLKTGFHFLKANHRLDRNRGSIRASVFLLEKKPVLGPLNVRKKFKLIERGRKKIETE